MNFTEGFGKKWIEKILGKVDKDQGVANAGKVLGIGDDGQVVPVEQSGGVSEQLFEKFVPSNGNLYYNHNKLSYFDVQKTPIVMVVTHSFYKPVVTVNSVDEANSLIHIDIASNTGGSGAETQFFAGHMNALDSSAHTASIVANRLLPGEYSSSVDINGEAGSVIFNGPFTYSCSKSNGSPYIAYTITDKTTCYARRTSDSKIYKVIIDNLNNFLKVLDTSGTIDYILVPPNTISNSPFPDA